MSGTPKPILTTLVIGADYTRALQKCLDSKRAYAEKHGYTLYLGGEQYWDRKKPIAWSKIPFLLDICSKSPEGALIWQSDADILITNPSYTVEEQILPLLPPSKDMLMTFDSCHHVNSGSILFRNTAWARDFWKRVGEATQFTYHIWWENAAIDSFYHNNPEDRKMIEVTKDHKKFNAYLRGYPNEPLWEPGDFLVHFAGVYDLKKMEELAAACERGETPRLPM